MGTHEAVELFADDTDGKVRLAGPAADGAHRGMVPVCGRVVRDLEVGWLECGGELHSGMSSGERRGQPGHVARVAALLRDAGRTFSLIAVSTGPACDPAAAAVEAILMNGNRGA